MRPLSKYHIYSLFLEKQTNDTMIFKNRRPLNIAISAVVTAMFWGVFFFFVYPLPDTHPDKMVITYFTTGLGSLGALMFIHFLTSYETLTIRKPLNSVTYESQTMTGTKGWKCSLDEFRELKVYTSINADGGGIKMKQEAAWVFDLNAPNRKLSIPIYPSFVHIRAEDRDKAIEFAKNISAFMDVTINITG